MGAKKTPKTVKSIECLFNIKVERLEGYLQTAEMINNFDIAVGIKSRRHPLTSTNLQRKCYFISSLGIETICNQQYMITFTKVSSQIYHQIHQQHYSVWTNCRCI
jgi:hypothetical protein